MGCNTPKAWKYWVNREHWGDLKRGFSINNRSVVNNCFKIKDLGSGSWLIDGRIQGIKLRLWAADVKERFEKIKKLQDNSVKKSPDEGI